MPNRTSPGPLYECIAKSAVAIGTAKKQIAKLRINLDGTIHQIERSTRSIKTSLALLAALNEQSSLPGRQVQALADGKGPETAGGEADAMAALPRHQPKLPEAE